MIINFSFRPDFVSPLLTLSKAISNLQTSEVDKLPDKIVNAKLRIILSEKFTSV